MNIDKEREAKFEEWLIREMPPLTVIGNPKWWAPRILRAARGALDEQKPAPSDDELISLAYDVGAMPEQMTDASLKRYARALLSKYAAPVNEQDAKDAQPSDEDLALVLLDTLFTAWEDGTPCYERPDLEAGFLGNAFRLDDHTIKACVALLERRRPRCDAIAQQGKGEA